MTTYSDCVRETVDGRHREVFCDWLAALRPTGWSGAVTELGDALAAFLAGHRLKHGCSFPTGSGLSKWLATADDLIEGAGRQPLFTRTKSERRITFTAAAPAPRV